MFIVLYRVTARTADTANGQPTAGVGVGTVASQVRGLHPTGHRPIDERAGPDRSHREIYPQPDSRDGTSRTAARPITVKSPFTEGSVSSDLPKLMENATTSSGQTIKGRININQAPRAVLHASRADCRPGPPIIAKRVEGPKDDTQDHSYETWPLTRGSCR